MQILPSAARAKVAHRRAMAMAHAVEEGDLGRAYRLLVQVRLLWSVINANLTGLTF